MNEVLNTFLSAGDSAMSKQHLRQPGFTRGACGPFSKDKKVMQNLNYVALLKNLPKGTAADKVLPDIDFNIAENPKYDRYQPGLASMIYNFFDKKTSGVAAKSEIILNQELTEANYQKI